MQIIKAASGVQKGWSNHPATIAWKHNTGALYNYGLVVAAELTARGKNPGKTLEALLGLDKCTLTSCDLPKWWGDAAIHRSHRSWLARKNAEHYGMWLTEFDNIDSERYWWPIWDDTGYHLENRGKM